MSAAAALAAGPCGRTLGVAASWQGPAAPQSSPNAAAGCDCVRSHCPQPSSWRGCIGNSLGRQNPQLTASWNSSNVFHLFCPLEQSRRSRSSSSSSRQIGRSSFRARSAAESESGNQVPPKAVGPRGGPTSENKGVGGKEQQDKQAGGSKGQAAALSALERARAYAAAKKGDGSSGSLGIGGVGLQQETFSAASQPLIGNLVTSQLLSTPTAGKVRESSDVAVGGNEQGAAKTADCAGAEVSIAQLATGAAYEQQQAQMVAALQAQRQQHQAKQAGSDLTAGSNGASQVSASPATETKQQPGMVEVEIVTRDGIIRRQLSQREMAQWGDSSSRSTYGARSSSSSNSSDGAAAAGRKSAASPLQQRQPELKLSSKDFAGLGFAEDKGRSRTQLPAGLAAPLEPRPPGQLPEVEIITRDGASQAGPQAESDGGGHEVYKPKVATWGVFARPRDISKTYGGGRTIRPGQALETAEEKAAREARTRQLLEQYSLLVGLKIDPAVKQACEEALEEGGRLMEQGKLSEAMAQFDEVMKKVVFRNNLHAKAALQKALCLDSLARSDEARELYEKLVGHPDESVKRKARQMLFGFRAAESLRFNGGSTWDVEWYKKYFDSLAEKSLYNNVYKADSAATDDATNNAIVEVLVYSILVMPLLLVAAAVVTKGQ